MKEPTSYIQGQIYQGSTHLEMKITIYSKYNLIFTFSYF